MIVYIFEAFRNHDSDVFWGDLKVVDFSGRVGRFGPIWVNVDGHARATSVRTR